MIIFKDLLSGEELFTDAQKPKLNEDGTMFTFPAKVITKRMDEDVQLEGANPSAEEAPEESSEAEMQSGFDFVFSNRLVPRELATKKEIQAYFKGFFKALKTHMQESGESSEKIKEMEGAAVKVVKDLLQDWENLSFFQGRDADPVENNVMCIVVKWNDDGTSGVAHAIRCGLKEEKV